MTTKAADEYSQIAKRMKDLGCTSDAPVKLEEAKPPEPVIGATVAGEDYVAALRQDYANAKTPGQAQNLWDAYQQASQALQGASGITTHPAQPGQSPQPTTSATANASAQNWRYVPPAPPPYQGPITPGSLTWADAEYDSVIQAHTRKFIVPSIFHVTACWSRVDEGKDPAN